MLEQILHFVEGIFVGGIVVLLIKYLEYKKDIRKDDLEYKTAISKDRAEVDGKMIDSELIQRREFMAEIALIRKEAKDRSDHYENQIVGLQKQLDEWKEKYYKLFEKYTQLIASNSELRGKYNELIVEINKFKAQ